eukprot:1046715-Amphidinium_carterae.1
MPSFTGMSTDAISLASSSAARSPGAAVLPASSSAPSGSCALLAPLAPPELAVVSAKRGTL